LRTNRLEVGEPCSNDLAQAIAAQAVLTGAPFLPHLDQAGLFEHLEVSGGGRPRMLEARGEVPRGQLPASLREQDENVTARLVSERGEDRVDVRERGPLHARQ
jgi:hypothetical protein